MTTPDSLNLDAYFGRIGYNGGREASLEVLTALHAAHLASIPFENVDVLLGRRIRLDLASLQAKLVDANRGGYCFEQNTLFAAVLRHLGFQVTTLTAQLSLPGERRILRGRTLTLRRKGHKTVRDVEEADLIAVLRESFGIALPPATDLATQHAGRE